MLLDFPPSVSTLIGVLRVTSSNWMYATWTRRMNGMINVCVDVSYLEDHRNIYWNKCGMVFQKFTEQYSHVVWLSYIWTKSRAGWGRGGGNYKNPKKQLRVQNALWNVCFRTHRIWSLMLSKLTARPPKCVYCARKKFCKFQVFILFRGRVRKSLTTAFSLDSRS